MKKLLTFFFISITILSSCKSEKKDKKSSKEPIKNEYASFGNKISSNNTLTTMLAYDKMKTLAVGDTINLKFTSTIKEVCTKKGCWMKLPLNDQTETMVRFKDYSFFMPLDSKGKEVIVSGKAFIKETSVDELKHYAEDAGKSKEEIEKITNPKKEFAFLADGVLMKK
ncbi:conserved protein of unknown function [Tenacibaculum sp. 190524A02b]|uniref:DUF4920 domain-containing protein n=1 Tax=Tenacibaculum vairaonense TaxID=3137860 RepID=UPI0032B0F5FC